MKAKRLFTLSALLAVMCLVVALFFGSTMGAKTAKAEEVADGTTYEVSGEISEDGALENEESAAKVEHTVWSRLGEWFSHNFLEFLSSVDLVAMVGCVTAVVLERKSNKKNTQETKTSIKENTAEIKRNTESNDEVLRVANQLIDSTNALAACEEKRDVDVAQLLVLNKAVLEILVTVYVNNKNIPQATKDLVNMKYVAAIKGGTSETPDEVKEVSEG